jgi:photosystem II stability/assembly factor-like uncharacterized protein
MILFAAEALALSWVIQYSGTTASLRGLDVVSSKVIWASGSHGTYLETIDGGNRWKVAAVPGAETLDFRDVKAFDQQAAFLLSSGPGDQSRIYKTSDAGQSWHLLFTNPDEKGFWDAICFWDPLHGIVLGDPVDGHFSIFTTDDGGEHWTRRASPAALPNEGAFAASGTCLVALGKEVAWFGTGGPDAGRVFRSSDQGRTWSVSNTPMDGTSISSGIYSLAFRDEMHGIAVGGDYQHPDRTSGTVALTDDGGRTWRRPNTELNGYRSGVSFVGKEMLVAVGTSGSDISRDGGKNWRMFSKLCLNAVAAFANSVWGVGPDGRIVKLELPEGEP